MANLLQISKDISSDVVLVETCQCRELDLMSLVVLSCSQNPSQRLNLLSSKQINKQTCGNGIMH